MNFKVDTINLYGGNMNCLIKTLGGIIIVVFLIGFFMTLWDMIPFWVKILMFIGIIYIILNKN